jgi:hypothetical protein
MTACSVNNCERAAITRGWCDKHYRRWKTTGSPEDTLPKGPAPQPAIDRLLAKVIESDDGCWIYTGNLQRNGYASIYLPTPIDGHVRAHRFSYEFFIDNIPNELEIDHLCNRRACVNPWHMEPVTHAENMRRGSDRLWDNRTVCARGHLINPDDVRTHAGAKPGYIGRYCRQCDQQSKQKQKQKATV